MNVLTNTDLHFVVSRIPRDVLSLIKNEGLILGGGFIRATIAQEKVSDIDLFGDNEERLKTIAYKFTADRKGGRFTESKNAITILSSPRLPVQIIKRWLFKDANEVVNSFDFTICQAAIWFSKDDNLFHSVVNDSFYSDLAARRLVYTSPMRSEDAGGSMLRVRKFISKGYNIQAESLAAVMARVFIAIDKERAAHAFDMQNESDVAKIIRGLLIEVDPLILIDGVELLDEHEVVS